jgi:hypothetical protein
VAELIGELEALDQPVANLLVRRFALATGKSPTGLRLRAAYGAPSPSHAD